MKPLSSSQRCRFHFLIRYNSKGFYVIPNRGNPNHDNHHRIPASKHLILARLISKTEEDLVRDLSHADASLGTMRNAIHAKSGKVFNRNTLFHIRGL